MKINTLLIANRGEIACRIIATAQTLGMRTVAVYSDADANALHVRRADEAHRLGPAPALESYLNIDAVLAAAKRSGADAIHPGYGFLSENERFAQACEHAGIVFVGPSSAAIRAMGAKIEAKRLVAAAGTPVVPGYQGEEQSDTALMDAAREVGYPLLIKASAGGGGKGMRLVEKPEDFNAALHSARREAAAAFGDERMLLERYLVNPKHLEVQVLADNAGRTIGIFERDCSVQRRHQKVIEEAPGPTVNDPLRRRLIDAAIKAARAINYTGAGTVEFIAERRGGKTDFYFMEMNTRLQVEHPVTEEITGIDLVEWQLRVAQGEAVQFEPDASGHAIEARLYAENPATGFLPSAGKLRRLRFPSGIRVDAGVTEGDSVSVHYDPMVAKLIARGKDREDARRTLVRALGQMEIVGIEHNAAYLKNLLSHPRFIAGDYGTHLADDLHDEVVPRLANHHWALAGCAAVLLAGMEHGQPARVHPRSRGEAGNGSEQSAHPWLRTDGWRTNQPSRTEVWLRRGDSIKSIRVDGHRIVVDGEVVVLENFRLGEGALSAEINGYVREASFHRQGGDLFLMLDGETWIFECLHDVTREPADMLIGADRIVSPMPGQVISLAVGVGDQVEEGALLAVIEAMKMEHSIYAPCAGEVTEIDCEPGQRVEEHARLLVLEPQP